MDKAGDGIKDVFVKYFVEIKFFWEFLNKNEIRKL